MGSNFGVGFGAKRVEKNVQLVTRDAERISRTCQVTQILLLGVKSEALKIARYLLDWCNKMANNVWMSG